MNFIKGRKQIVAGALLMMLAANPLEAYAAENTDANAQVTTEALAEKEAAVTEEAVLTEDNTVVAAEENNTNAEVTDAAAEETVEETAENAQEQTAEEAKPVIVKPGKVKGVKAVKVSKTSVTIKWSAAKNASGYQIYRKAQGGSWKLVKTVSASTKKFTDKSLNENKKYYYKVRAFAKNNGKKTTGKFSSVVTKKIIATKGEKVVEYANKFVGNPYRWGGNSLTSGCDCSGFVVAVYSHFGVNLSGSRNSTALRSVGKSVALKDIQKGDIVCYNHHVAIYNGDGKIVEAQSSRTGITNYRGLRPGKVITVRRVVE